MRISISRQPGTIVAYHCCGPCWSSRVPPDWIHDRLFSPKSQHHRFVTRSAHESPTDWFRQHIDTTGYPASTPSYQALFERDFSTREYVDDAVLPRHGHVNVYLNGNALVTLQEYDGRAVVTVHGDNLQPPASQVCVPGTPCTGERKMAPVGAALAQTLGLDRL